MGEHDQEAPPRAATHESILASRLGLKRHELDVPEWGGRVWIRELSGLDRSLLGEAWDRYRKSSNGDEDNWVGYEEFVAAWCLVDESGRRIFKDSEVTALSQTPGGILHRVFDFAQKVNALGPYAVEVLPKSSAPIASCSTG